MDRPFGPARTLSLLLLNHSPYGDPVLETLFAPQHWQDSYALTTQAFPVPDPSKVPGGFWDQLQDASGVAIEGFYMGDHSLGLSDLIGQIIHSAEYNGCPLFVSARGLKGTITGYEIIYQNMLLKTLEANDIVLIVTEGEIVTAFIGASSYTPVQAYAHLCRPSGWLEAAQAFLSRVSTYHSTLWQGPCVHWRVGLS